jgi:hypothetical protein
MVGEKQEEGIRGGGSRLKGFLQDERQTKKKITARTAQFSVL